MATPRFCSTSRIVGQLRSPLKRDGDVRHECGSETFRRLVDQEQRVVVQERPRDRDHLLLAAGERAGTLAPAFPELGEELVDKVIASVAAAHGEAKVLFDGQAGEDVPILWDVSDAAPHDRMRWQPGCVLAVDLDRPARTWHESQERPQRRRLADPVPAKERGHAALLDRERDSLQHMRFTEIDVQILDLEGRGAAHRGSPRYAVWTVSFAMTAAGSSNASKAPWCITAIR